MPATSRRQKAAVRAVLLVLVGLFLAGAGVAPFVTRHDGAYSYAYDGAVQAVQRHAAPAPPVVASRSPTHAEQHAWPRPMLRSAVLRNAAEEGLPALRQAYVDDVASISDNAAAWEKAGADPELIARESWADRRALGIQYKGLTPPDMLEQITARNIARYGDPLGPSVDWLRAQGRTWQQIIESATRPGGQDLGF
jgi:hypothetical protein